MQHSSASKRCPNCGAEIQTEAPQGLCPRCLLSEASVPTEAGAGNPPKSPPPSIDLLAAAFPHLEILSLIGQGGMGFVFKARQPKLERFVALKILPEKLAADPAFAERFSREGRVLARLNHPNIVTVHDFGQANGFFYLLMEYVDGVNLRLAMKAGRFTPEQALAVVPRICDALEFAHNEGVLHRDIKPENILLDSRGRVKIADFGIAKIVGAGSGLMEKTVAAGEHNVTGVAGTPQYMAPEQLENPTQVDHRADIYSLGVVFYEMLTGELPLGRFAPPSRKSSADPRLDEVVLRALEKEPGKRTATAVEMKTQVQTIAADMQAPPVVPPVLPQERELQKIEPKATETPGFDLRRGLAAGILVFLLCVSAALAISAMLPRTYVGTARILLRSEPNAFGETYDPYRVQTEMEAITSADLLRRVAVSRDLSIHWGRKYNRGTPLHENTVARLLRNSLEVQNSRNTEVLQIRFYSDTPREAAEIANRIAEEYRALPRAARAIIIEQATPALRPLRPNLPLNILIGLGVGLIGGVTAFVVGGLLSDSRGTSGTGEDKRPAKAMLRRGLALGTVALIVIGASAIFWRLDPRTKIETILNAQPLAIEDALADQQRGKGAPGTTNLAVPSVTIETANASSNQFNIELARLKLQSAEESAHLAQKQYEAGRIAQLDLDKAFAERDIARAELNGDAVEVARIQLKIAEKELSVAQKRLEVGAIDSFELARAKLAHDRAVIVLRQKQAENEK